MNSDETRVKEQSSESQHSETDDKFTYSFKNIIRLGLEIVFSSRSPPSSRSRFLSIFKHKKQSNSAAKKEPFPHGINLSSEKNKTTLNLDNREAVFTSYAPRLFNYFRSLMDIKGKSLLESLCSKPLLDLSGKSGKSGMSFFISPDNKYVIKTVTLAEKEFLLKILKKYIDHFDKNRHSLISVFIGLYKITQRGLFTTRTIFVVMNNVFGSFNSCNSLEKFDLKGTTEDRFVNLDLKQKNSREERNRTVKKDINFGERNLLVTPEFRLLLTEQVRRDIEFFRKNKIMDYSLLLGLIKMSECERMEGKENKFEIVNIFENNELIKIGEEYVNIFRQTEGGFLGESYEKEGEECRDFYLLGIIDFLQPYNLFKKTAHQYKKQIRYAFTEVELDTVHPNKYAERFVKYINKIVVCGGGGKKSLDG